MYMYLCIFPYIYTYTYIFIYYIYVGELRKSASYKNFLVLPSISETDGSKTIKIIFIFKKYFSIDSFLTYLYLPYRITDLVQELYFDLKSNIIIEEIFCNVSTSLDYLVKFKLDVRANYVKYIFIDVLEVNYMYVNIYKCGMEKKYTYMYIYIYIYIYGMFLLWKIQRH
jgi:hypothetical protein